MEQAERALVGNAGAAHHHTNAFAGVANVIIDPITWARGLARQPRWAVALACIVVVRFAGLVAFYGPSVSVGGVVAGVAFQVMTIVPAVVAVAFLFWTAALLCRTRLSWPVAFAIVTHVYFAHALVTTAIASVAGALLPATVDVDLRAPPFTNLGGLVLADSSGGTAIARAVDIRSVYAVGLAAIAIRAASPTAGWRRAWWAPAACFAVALLLAIAGAADG
jgi:hypothetical protein